jgi:8-oxo-dGTP pyrophosphatase MutT (NUDIX family)
MFPAPYDDARAFLAADERGSTLMASFSMSAPDEVSAGPIIVRRNSTGEVEAFVIRRGKGWEVPKGHVELGESAEYAAEREVAEEAGVRGIAVGREVDRVRYSVRSRTNKAVLVFKTVIYFLSTPSEGFIVDENAREEATKEVAWVTQRTLANFSFKSAPTMVTVSRALELGVLLIPAFDSSCAERTN